MHEKLSTNAMHFKGGLVSGLKNFIQFQEVIASLIINYQIHSFPPFPNHRQALVHTTMTIDQWGLIVTIQRMFVGMHWEYKRVHLC